MSDADRGQNAEANFQDAIGSLFTNQVTWSGEGTQTLYLLTRDSIEVFMHQKRASMSAGATLLGWLGIFVTILLTLNTATFSDTVGVDADLIRAMFVMTAVLSGALALRDAWRWFRADNSPGKLAEELGRRGIRPPNLPG